jgi:prepilin-type N-terminal cleavage/methylation domain-containing protein
MMLPTYTAFRPRRAFTLIELLTVIAIVGILAAIIVPVVGRARMSASRATMTSNLRQIGISMGLFAADNRNALPGLYVAGTDAGGLNHSFALGTGQSAYANYSGTGTEPRTTLQSIDQLGRYITRSTVTIDGSTKLYCSLLESPAFASQRPAGVFPTSVELGISVMGDNGSLVYPFGNKTAARGSMRYSQLGASFNPSKRWMVIEIDKTTPKEVDATLANASWYSALPDKPVHGGAWLALMYDGSVTSLAPGDARLANTAAQ